MKRRTRRQYMLAPLLALLAAITTRDPVQVLRTFTTPHKPKR